MQRFMADASQELRKPLLASNVSWGSAPIESSTSSLPGPHVARTGDALTTGGDVSTSSRSEQSFVTDH